MDTRNSTPSINDYHILSYLPQEGVTHYPQIPPGMYIFIQNKDSKEVFLFLSPFGHGHNMPLLSQVNKFLKLELSDTSWLGCAGEQLFGTEGELLGFSVMTGKFHEILNLTQPSSSQENYKALIEAYKIRMQKKLEADRLPFSRFFFKDEWSRQLFTTANRTLLLSGTGALRRSTDKQLLEIKQHLKLNDDTTVYSGEVRALFEKLFQAIQKVPYKPVKQKLTRTLSACPSATFHRIPENKNASVDFSTPPGLKREILASPSPTPPPSTLTKDEVNLSLSGLSLAENQDDRKKALEDSFSKEKSPSSKNGFNFKLFSLSGPPTIGNPVSTQERLQPSP